MMLAGLLALAGLAQEPSAAPARPNLVLILADDLDTGHLGFLGNAQARTPTLDRLAREGALLRTAWAQPVCRPALATLLTGRWPHEHGIVTNQHPVRTLDPAGTLPQRLAEAGYATYCAGKWWEGELASFGFDAPAEPDPRFAREGEGTEDLARFLAERAPSEPFFVWWAPSLPHTPHRPPARFTKAFAEVEPPVPADFPGDPDEYRAAERASLAMHAWLDAELKQLIDGLAQAGELADTRFVFVGDNGWATALNSKGTPREQGLRSPVILWSGGEQTASASDALVDLVDVTATLLDWAGVTPVEGARGRSLAPLLRGEPWQGREQLFGEVYTRDGTLFALCARDERWKFVQYVTTARARDLSPGPRFAPEFRRRAGALELFDLSADPTELTNLARQEEHAARVAEWRAATLEWWQTTGGGTLPEPEER